MYVVYNSCGQSFNLLQAKTVLCHPGISGLLGQDETGQESQKGIWKKMHSHIQVVVNMKYNQVFVVIVSISQSLSRKFSGSVQNVEKGKELLQKMDEK